MKQTRPDIKKTCCIPSREVRSDLQVSDYQTVNPDLPTNPDPPPQTGKAADPLGAPSTTQLRSLPGGWFYMGTDRPLYKQDGESPRRHVFVSPFSIAATTVSNADFARFVSETGYVTSAETLGRSFVFNPCTNSTSANSASVTYAPWWHDTEAACWHSPQGAGSSIEALADHPVTHVSYTDALHYCDWSGTRLPTEAQWEYAARGEHSARGEHGARDEHIDCGFPWGDTLEPDGQHLCNVWQGQFPTHNIVSDGYERTAPVSAYPPNSFGLHNMTGNVWEWVADRFTANHSPRPVKNPAGPLNGNNFVTRGGSFLCHHSYCARYHVFSRQALSAETSCANVGFRVASSIVD